MKHSFITRKLDAFGRITLPKQIRSFLQLNADDELRLSLDGNRIILEKTESSTYDLFDNMIVSEPLYDYHGKKISRTSILDLANMAGLISEI